MSVRQKGFLACELKMLGKKCVNDMSLDGSGQALGKLELVWGLSGPGAPYEWSQVFSLCPCALLWEMSIAIGEISNVG